MEAGTIKKIAIGIAIPILLLLLAALGAAIWYFVIFEPPERVLEGVIASAQSNNPERFQSYFSSASVRALEGSWKGDGYGRSGSWDRMMKGILETSGGAPLPEGEPEITEDGQRAKMRVRLRGNRRTIYFVQEDGDWRVDILSGVNAGVSEEARKEAKVELDPEKQKKEESFTEEPKRDGWWKKE